MWGVHKQRRLNMTAPECWQQCKLTQHHCPEDCNLHIHHFVILRTTNVYYYILGLLSYLFIYLSKLDISNVSDLCLGRIGFKSLPEQWLFRQYFHVLLQAFQEILG
jgi:hypothetical protein